MNSFRTKALFGAASLFLLLALIFVSCGESNNPASSSDPVPPALWSPSIEQNYVIDQQRSCFCPPPHGVVRLRVVEDTIVEGVLVDGGDTLEASVYGRYKTINELIELVEKAQIEGADIVRVRYDSASGFPASIFIDWSIYTADEEIWYSTSLVQILR